MSVYQMPPSQIQAQIRGFISIKVLGVALLVLSHFTTPAVCPAVILSVPQSTSFTINFSLLMMAMIMKPCKGIVLNMLYKHAH